MTTVFQAKLYDRFIEKKNNLRNVIKRIRKKLATVCIMKILMIVNEL